MKITLETIIMFKRTPFQAGQVFINGAELVPDRSFNWGYLGTAPALLARALLKLMEMSAAEVQRYYHLFITEVVGSLRYEDVMTGEDLIAWVEVTRNERGAI